MSESEHAEKERPPPFNPTEPVAQASFQNDHLYTMGQEGHSDAQPPSYEQATDGQPPLAYQQSMPEGAYPYPAPAYHQTLPGAYSLPAGPSYGYPKQEQAGPQFVQGGMVMTNQPGPMVVAGHPGYSGVQAVVVTQPTLMNPPPDYLVWSIVSCLCCCWPIGIVAIIYSIGSRDAARRGDESMAFVKSQSAKKACIAATVCGLIIISLNVLTRVLWKVIF